MQGITNSLSNGVPDALAKDLSIQLEVLDAQDHSIAGMAARLRDMRGEHAVVVLDNANAAPCLCWGAKIRFTISDGFQCYHVLGAVVAHDIYRRREMYRDAGDTVGAGPVDIHLRLRACHPISQRRRLQRRETGFPVRYRLVNHATEGQPSGKGAPLPAVSRERNAGWLRAWCVDVGGGGMRIRVTGSVVPSGGLDVHFSVRVSSGEDAAATQRAFLLHGRILRADAARHRANHMELAVRFDRLSVEDGLALSSLLADQ